MFEMFDYEGEMRQKEMQMVTSVQREIRRRRNEKVRPVQLWGEFDRIPGKQSRQPKQNNLNRPTWQKGEQK